MREPAGRYGDLPELARQALKSDAERMEANLRMLKLLGQPVPGDDGPSGRGPHAHSNPLAPAEGDVLRVLHEIRGELLGIRSEVNSLARFVKQAPLLDSRAYLGVLKQWDLLGGDFWLAPFTNGGKGEAYSAHLRQVRAARSYG